MKNKRLPATLDHNTYMREYMRRKHPGRQPRKEIYEAKRVEFERVVRTGGYGSLASLCRQIGITANTGAKRDCARCGRS